MTLIERIDVALNGEPLSYDELARRLWPDGKAWRYSKNGGPPGCYMALSAGLRRGGFSLQALDKNRSNAARLVYPRANRGRA
jgi:hypothetical protein